MTAEAAPLRCALCAESATESVEPPRKTLARGTDPIDSSYSVTVILPDVSLCATHAEEVRHGARTIGWCDDERCRSYGEAGGRSACGGLYEKLGPSRH